MDWQEEPATQQQLLRLQEYGFVPTFNLTVTQAARLIRQYSKRPARSVAPAAASPTPPTAPASVARHVPAEPPAPPPQTRSEMLSQSAKMHAFRLHAAVEAAEEVLAETPDRPGARADVQAALGARQRFWLDTCREGRDLQAASAEALEFHQQLGARYFTPTWEEVAEVLEALDRAMAEWDKDHPELFYETLKLNFPSLLRHKQAP